MTLDLGNCFLDTTSRAQAIKEKIDKKFDFIKIKNFRASKDTIRKEKNPWNERKYLQITLSDKG